MPSCIDEAEHTKAFDYRGGGGKPKCAEPFPGKIGRWILNLIALALTVTELFNKMCEKV